MHPADINAALQKADSSQSKVARSLLTRYGRPITASAVHLVVKGRMRSARIALRISEVTGLPVSVMWPGHYPELEQRERQVASPRRARALKEAA